MDVNMGMTGLLATELLFLDQQSRKGIGAIAQLFEQPEAHHAGANNQHVNINFPVSNHHVAH
jgi:hypothetical protein